MNRLAQWGVQSSAFGFDPRGRIPGVETGRSVEFTFATSRNIELHGGRCIPVRVRRRQAFADYLTGYADDPRIGWADRDCNGSP
jgi:hypothetical protein